MAFKLYVSGSVLNSICFVIHSHMNPLNEGVLSPDIEAISKRVHDGHGSFVDFTFAGLLSEEWLKNVKENGAVFLLSRDIIMYQYLFEKVSAVSIDTKAWCAFSGMTQQNFIR